MDTTNGGGNCNVRGLGGSLIRLLELYPVKQVAADEGTTETEQGMSKEEVNSPSPVKSQREGNMKRNRVVNSHPPKQDVLDCAEVGQYLIATGSKDKVSAMQANVLEVRSALSAPSPVAIPNANQCPSNVLLTPLVPTGEYVPSYDTKEQIKYSLVGEPGTRCQSPLPLFRGSRVDDQVREATMFFSNLLAARQHECADQEMGPLHGGSGAPYQLPAFYDILSRTIGTSRSREAGQESREAGGYLPLISPVHAGATSSGRLFRGVRHSSARLRSNTPLGNDFCVGGVCGLMGRRLIGVPVHDRRLNAHLMSSWEKGVKARLPARKAFKAIKSSCWWRLAGSREGLLLAARLVNLDADVYESLLTRWVDGIRHSYTRFVTVNVDAFVSEDIGQNLITGPRGRKLGPVLPFSGSEAVMNSLFPGDVELSDMLGVARQLGYLQMGGALCEDDVARVLQCDTRTIQRELRRLMLQRSGGTVQPLGVLPIFEGKGCRLYEPNTAIRQISRAILRARRRAAAEEAKKKGRKIRFSLLPDVTTCSRVLQRRLQKIAASRPGDVQALLEQLGVLADAVNSGGLESIKSCPEVLSRLQEIIADMPPDVQASLQQLGFLTDDSGRISVSSDGRPRVSRGRSRKAANVVPSNVHKFLKKLDNISRTITGGGPPESDGSAELLQRGLQEIAASRPGDVQALLEQLGVLADAVNSGGLESIKSCPEALSRLQEIAASMPPDVRASLQQLGFLPDGDGVIGVENLCEVAKRQQELSSGAPHPSEGMRGATTEGLKSPTEGASFSVSARRKIRRRTPKVVKMAAADEKGPIVHNVPPSSVKDQGEGPAARDKSALSASSPLGDEATAWPGNHAAFAVDESEADAKDQSWEDTAFGTKKGLLKKRRRLRSKTSSELETLTDDDAERALFADKHASFGKRSSPGRFRGRTSPMGVLGIESFPTSGDADDPLSGFVASQLKESYSGPQEGEETDDYEYTPRERSRMNRSRAQPVFSEWDTEQLPPQLPSGAKDPRLLSQTASILVFPNSGRRGSRAASVASRTACSDTESVRGVEDPWELSSMFSNDDNELALFLATFPDEERHVQLRREAHRVLDDINAGSKVLEEYAIKLKVRPSSMGPSAGAGGGMQPCEQEWTERDEQMEKRMLECRVDIQSMVERFKAEAQEEYADLWRTLQELRKRVEVQEALLEETKLDINRLSYPMEGEDTDAFALRLTREVNAFAEQNKLDPQQLKDLTTAKQDREAAVRSFLESFARTRGRRGGVSVGCQCTPKDLGYIDTEVLELNKQMEDLQYHARGLLNSIKLVVISMGNVLSFHSALELESTCKRCFCIFEEPRTLWPCGHSFCLHCLTQMISKGGELICDECGTLCLVGYTPNFAIEMVAGYQLMWINSAEDDVSEDSLCSSPSPKSSLTSSNSKGSKPSSHAGQKRRTVEKVLAGLLKDLLSTQGSGKATRKTERKSKKPSKSTSGELPLPPLKGGLPPSAATKVQCA
ncbi:hypothetical protein, conserved [Trypanosoma brucei brucei TREU927]|uniref:RING-type domain-containing protein n=1 Tax=Trypanosoma brucei brucei (strain 927/4 GUTat10.1) TaxID=185431 RepID=Q581W0_TRYB2|nr:hypothetical protein, conserved [Trypanosoma brucei brucei TREU927]AAX79443.1 hypothetical protein, conserved [Trypanosoma brucei]AAZ12989.1 hypothetical protein, conserved [Trypanosoma brucei brucei TREU927]